ncbi:Glycosyl hydrolases family 38 protein [Brugia malayi]|uniref:Glycosyl hydrolases family 38 protein n=2 Tax=Brugia malayi TaxID=6279 RepID=A0A4E9FB04_BRUMA|nr:Glycosyl hydrolases family 38 protein [Brugia malayi]VIO90879.1 Glycosyl hydrolases family 38 protein [Brugia malayi]
MLKLHVVLLITAFGTLTIFLSGEFISDYLSLMMYREINGSDIWIRSAERQNNICATFQRLSNAIIEIDVKGHSIQLIQNKQNAPKHLNVFVVLHSHVDPGWLYTFEEYYSTSDHPVRKILNNIVNSLRKYPKLRFIWSEMSFLERWWSEANTTYRNYFKSLIDEGHLEISGGHWVMNDEATPYFWEAIENIIVGHQYVHEILNITPTTSWSVDPFGHGLMMPYLMKLAGINQMVIGRINSNIKNILKQHHQLHFRWAQNWDSQLHWAPLVNVLPNAYYTVTSACGTDEMICCQFDVSKTSRSSCMERAKVDNVQKIALYGERMANQYRSLQTFYNSEAVLVAAGDDFLYSDSDDLKIVHRVYSALFKYINRNYDRFNMRVQFGTVADYFKSLKGNAKRRASILSGDFFPYMDNAFSNAPFWTGFYNHRAYFKCFERIIQRELRLVDLLSVAIGIYLNSDVEIARRNLALSIHHDAITGTSKRHVMDDYMLRLRSALHIILKEQERLLSISDETFTTLFVNNSVKTKGMYLPRITFSFADGIESYKIQIVSQKTFSTMELVKINVSSPFITVTHNDKLLTIQVVRILKQSDLFELVYNDGSMETNFALYFNRINDYGGAYTMVSAGLSLENITDKNRLSPTIIQGPIYSSITQQLSSQLAYSITIINSTDDNARSIQIDLFTNVTLSPGYDRKMKLEANIYPMITETVIEDDKLRCTVLGAQSTGVTAKMGLVTLMVDREMYNDDGKGLDYYEASESHPSHLRYRIIFEPKTSEMKNFDDLKTIDKNELENKSSPMNTMYHSQLVQQTLEELLYPAALFLSSSINSTDNNEMSSVLIDLPRLPDNIQLITIRYIARKTILLSMRQLPYDCSVELYCKSDSNTV